ncbi:MAG: AgmX/PglI C-terminal domain-containing protein [Polyangiaceae bacterium]|nr:AgmX/PglI C-terminal domain-containing protein [Polyangiaceae bacterium]
MRPIACLATLSATLAGCIVVQRAPAPAQPAPQAASSDAAPPAAASSTAGSYRGWNVRLKPIALTPPSRGEPEADDVVKVRSRVNSEVEPHHPELRACYDEGLGRNDKLAGIVQVKFTVAPNGEPVAVADEGSSLSDKDVISCILSRFAKMRFTPWEGKAVTLLYPMEFSRAK